MRAELAFHHAAVRGEPLQRRADDGDAESQPGRGLGGGERPVRAGVAGDEVAERVRDRLDEGQRHAHGQRDAEGIAQPGGVLHRGEAFDAADVDLDGAVGPLQGGEVGGGVGRRSPGFRRRRTGPALRQLARRLRRSSAAASRQPRRRAARGRHRLQPGGDFLRRERTQQAQQVRDALQPAHLPVRGQPLQFALGGVDDLRIQQFAQLHAAQELVEQGGIQGQGGGPALGQRGVALVEELRHVAEQQGLRERRGLLGGGLDDPSSRRSTDAAMSFSAGRS